MPVVPQRKDYLDGADRNLDFADDRCLSDDKFMDWATIAIFYSAVHYINALGSLQPNRGEPFNNHTVRLDYVARAHPSISPEFQVLYNEAYNARYKCSRLPRPAVDDLRNKALAKIKDYVEARIRR